MASHLLPPAGPPLHFSATLTPPGALHTTCFLSTGPGISGFSLLLNPSLFPLPPSIPLHSHLCSLYARTSLFYLIHSQIIQWNWTTGAGSSMVRTRLQARLQERFGENYTTDSCDSEVSFNPAWLDSAFLGTRHPRDDEDQDEEQGEGEGHRHDDMADKNERRLQLLESAVMGMTEKFDELLGAISSQSAPTRQARQPAPSGPQATHHGRHYREVRPSPVDPRAPTYTDYVAEQLRREEFSVQRNDEGKTLASDMFIRELIPKPYMYITRPGLGTLKKKLDARDSMSFHEYLICYIKMIRDPRAESQGMLDTHLEHLQQVIQDAAARDWPSVRRWSQSTFDAVENGSATWDDRYGMQIERLHQAIQAATRPQQNVSQGIQADRRDIPCKDYNSPSGCINNRSHAGRTVTFVHVCSACFNAGDRSPHPACLCPRRAVPQQQAGPPMRQHVQAHLLTAATPASKNGMQASHHPGPVRPTFSQMINQ